MPCWSITSITTETMMNMTRMYNPSHPGATLREDVLRRSVFR